MSHSTVDAAALGARFAELHASGTFVMPNVADAGTAAALRDVGVEAIATTSSAHATTIGRQDAAGDVTMEEHAEHTQILIEAANLPCNVDGENGYAHDPEAMAAAVQRFAATGAAGLGIEDWSGDPAIGTYERRLAVARIEAAVEAANALDRPFIITGRTDVFLNEDGDQTAEATARLEAFNAVGAHCLYAPGTGDTGLIKSWITNLDAAVNVLVPLGRPRWWPADQGMLTMNLAAELGVRRISLGGSLYFSQVKHAADIMRSVLETGSPSASW